MLTDRVKKAVRGFALVGCFALAFSCAVEAAIPTKEECKAARAKLAELTSDDYKALKAKTKTNEQVGDALAGYADNEESAAGKFALLQDAFQQYVLGKSVDKAESVYSKAQTVGGVEYALEMARPSRSKLSAYATSKNAPAKALKERIMADEKSFQRVGIVKAKLKKSPGDESLCEQLGIEYAAIGDWESALAAFVTAAGEVAKVADWELNGGKGVDYTAATVGAFWWKFAENFPKRKNVEEAMKLHAAMWYKLALDKDAFKGNEKTIIEKRVAETEKFGAAEVQDKELLAKKMQMLTPILIELQKDNRIEFIGCPAGSFVMGKSDGKEATLTMSHDVQITRPFWLSKYKITNKQWNVYDKVSLTEWDSHMGGMLCPYHLLSYDKAMQFCNYLTKRYKNKLPPNYIIRLPTEAEWEYANHLGEGVTRVDMISVRPKDVRELAEKAKYDVSQRKDWQMVPVAVGTKMPNSIGLFDMLSNGFELTLDTVDAEKANKNIAIFKATDKQTAVLYGQKEIDPLRYFRSAEAYCIIRGSSFNNFYPANYDKRIYPIDAVTGADSIQANCIRLCIGPDLMKEKGYTAKAKKR